MALTNQATIQLAVNIQGLQDLRGLNAQVLLLVRNLRALQRNPGLRTLLNTATKTTTGTATGVGAVPKSTLASQQALAAAALLSKNRLMQLQGVTQKAGAAAQKMGGQVQKAGTMMKGAGVQAQSLTKKIQLAEERVDALWRASFRLTMLGSDFTRWGQNLIGAVVGPAQEFADFEFMALRAAASLEIFDKRTDTAFGGTRELEDSIIDLARELKLLPVDDVAKSVYFWGSTTGQVVQDQQDLRDVMNELKPILQSAEMTQTDYETAIKGTYSILTQYYPKIVETAKATGNYKDMTDQAEVVTTGLFYAAQKTSLEFDDLIQSFKMVGPVAAGAGATFEDVVGLLERLGDLGIRGSSAGRALRQMFIQMVRPAAVTRKALDGLFKSVEQFGGKGFMDTMFPEGRFVGTETFLRNWAIALKGATTQEKLFYLARFSTANLMPAMIALIGQETRKLEDNATATETSAEMHQKWAEYFEQSWGKLSGSTKAVFESLDRALEGLRITVGREFAEVLKPIVDQIRQIVDNVSDWVDKNPELVQTLGKVATYIGVALVALGGLFTTMGSAIGIVAGLRLAFEAFGGLFLKWTGYGLIVGGFIDAVIRNFDTVKQKLGEAQTAIQNAITNVQGYFSDGEDVAGGFGEAIKGVFDTIVNTSLDVIVAVSHIIEEISKFKPLFDTIKTFIIPIAMNFIGIWAGTKILGSIGLIQRLTTGIKGLVLASKGMALGHVVTNPFGDTQRMRSAASGIDRLKGSVTGLGSKLKGFAAAHFDLVLMGVAAFGFAAYQNNWLNFQGLVDGLAESFRNLDAEITSAFDDSSTGEHVVQMFDDLGTKSGVGFTQGMINEIESHGVGELSMGLSLAFKESMNQMGHGSIFTDIGGDFFGNIAASFDKGLRAVGLGDVLDNVMKDSFRDATSGTDDWFKGAVQSADDAKEAVANVNAELRQLNIDATTYWKGFELATKDLGLDPDWASRFGEALGRVFQDGKEDVGEFAAELDRMAVNGGSLYRGLNDAQREFLGLTTDAQREVEALTTKLDLQAASLVIALKGIDPTTLSWDNSKMASALIDQMNQLMSDVSPEAQKVMEEAIKEFTEAAANSGITDGMETARATLAQALTDMGKTHIDAATFNDLADQVSTALDDAMATMGDNLDENTMREILTKVLTDNDIKFVEDTIFPKINQFGDDVASEIGDLFKPEKFKTLLKDITSDKNGITNFMKALTDKTLQAALTGAKGSEAQALATQYAQGLLDNLTGAFPALLPATQQQLRTNLEKIFNEDSLPDMTPEMQKFGTDALVAMYEAMDEPIPPWLSAAFKTAGGTLADDTKAGFDSRSGELVLNAPEIKPPVLADGQDPMSFWNNYQANAQAAINNAPPVVIPMPKFGASGAGNKDMGDGSGMADTAVNTNTLQFLAGIQNTINTNPLNIPDVTGPDHATADSTVSTMVTDYTTKITTINTQVPDILAPNTTAASTAVTNIVSFVQTKLQSLTPLAQSWGSHLINNFAYGIRTSARAVSSAVQHVISQIPDYIKFTEPKKGPLRGVHVWGRHLMENFSTGMMQGIPSIRKAAIVLANVVGGMVKKIAKDSKDVGNALGEIQKAAGQADKKTGNNTDKTVDKTTASAKHMLALLKTVATAIIKMSDMIARASLALAKNPEKAAKILQNLAKEMKNVSDTVSDGLKDLSDAGKKISDDATGKNKKIADDVDKTVKKTINVNGAHFYNTYNDYLKYLDGVHEHVKKIKDSISKENKNVNHSIVMEKNQYDNKVTLSKAPEKKIVEVTLKVTSPDGSVNKVDQTQIRRGAMDALVLADIEHIVTVK